MKKILIVFGTFITVSLIFLGLTNLDEINAYINNDKTSVNTLALTETSEWIVDDADVEAFVETEQNHDFIDKEGNRPERGVALDGFDGERPTAPEGTFPQSDTQTGSTTQ